MGPDPMMMGMDPMMGPDPMMMMGPWILMMMGWIHDGMGI